MAGVITAISNSSLQSVTKAFQSDIARLLQIGQFGLPLLRAAFSS
jgi:hypothetical protein